jgi:hypothetical protein
MFDEFSVWEVGDDREFNGIKHTWMGVVGAADLKKSIIQGSDLPGYTYRANGFGYNEGTEVYLLDAPNGEVFVVQSYNAHTDDGLAKEVAPATLADRLTLPAGWTFRVKVLDQDLQVSTTSADHFAHVTQDDLLNRYRGSDGGKAFNHLP